jgi:hypothetical protein
MRDLCACTRRRHETSSHAPGDASFARSFDPCTSILTMLHGASFGGEAFESASRLGKLGQPRGTSTGAGMGGRSAARRVPPLPQGRGRGTSKKRKEIEVSVPARIEEFGFGCSHVVMQLQKSVGDVWPRISSANALQKERTGSSERGPSSERGSAGDTVGSRIERNARRTSASPRKSGEDRRLKAQGDERSASSGRHIARAVGRSRDRGCNGHRILRRVPTGGRHPGSSRSVGFHETTRTMVSAAGPPSDPCQTSSSRRGDRTHGQVAAGVKTPEA